LGHEASSFYISTQIIISIIITLICGYFFFKSLIADILFFKKKLIFNTKYNIMIDQLNQNLKFEFTTNESCLVKTKITRLGENYPDQDLSVYLLNNNELTNTDRLCFYGEGKHSQENYSFTIKKVTENLILCIKKEKPVIGFFKGEIEILVFSSSECKCKIRQLKQ